MNTVKFIVYTLALGATTLLAGVIITNLKSEIEQSLKENK